VLREAGEPDLGYPMGPRQSALGTIGQDVADVPHGHARGTGVVPHSPILTLVIVTPTAEVLGGYRLRLSHSGAHTVNGLPVLPRVLLVTSLSKGQRATSQADF